MCFDSAGRTGEMAVARVDGRHDCSDIMRSLRASILAQTTTHTKGPSEKTHRHTTERRTPFSLSLGRRMKE